MTSPSHGEVCRFDNGLAQRRCVRRISGRAHTQSLSLEKKGLGFTPKKIIHDMIAMETEKTVALVVRKGGKFLLLKRANRTGRGLWCIPGGHAETGETAEKAALREAREEIGEVLLGKFILKFVHDVRAGHMHEAHIFFARLKGKVKINEESSAYGWFTLEEMKTMALTDYTLYALNYMIEKKLI